MSKFAAAVGMIGLLLAGHAFAAEEPGALLSKADATQMFELSEDQWIGNVIAVKAAGVGDYAVAESGEYTLYMRPDPVAGLLIVSPSYFDADKTKPWKLTVTTVMDTPLASSLMDAMAGDDVEAMFAAVAQEMKPEFSVIGYLVRGNGGPPAVFFTIFETSAFPDVDELNRSGTVCPLGGCIRDSAIGN